MKGASHSTITQRAARLKTDECKEWREGVAGNVPLAVSDLFNYIFIKAQWCNGL